MVLKNALPRDNRPRILSVMWGHRVLSSYPQRVHLTEPEVCTNCYSQHLQAALTLLQARVQACVEHLLATECVVRTGSDTLAYSQLGRACVSSGLSPDEGLQLFGELQRARWGGCFLCWLFAFLLNCSVVVLIFFAFY